MATAEPSSIYREVSAPATASRSGIRDSLAKGVLAVIEAAFVPTNTTDLRQGILTVVHNPDTSQYEIRWDIAK